MNSLNFFNFSFINIPTKEYNEYIYLYMHNQTEMKQNKQIIRE